MPNVKRNNFLHLHVLVFIAGFTGIIGKLVTIDSIPLVWYRMAMALLFMLIYVLVAKVNLKASKKDIVKFSVAGIVVALHWITFFESIKQSNVSIALSMFSAGAFFASFIEPIIYKRKINVSEIIFGLLIIVGVALIMQSEFEYIYGIILGLFSALFSSIFAVLNGKFLEEHSASKISVYEFVSGVLCISIFLLFTSDFLTLDFFLLSQSDFLWLLILASVCTAYAFIASTYVMHHISPYTVVLTYNLEPVYAIILAYFFFNEKMPPLFYIGTGIILLTIIFNGVLKMKKNKNKD